MTTRTRREPPLFRTVRVRRTESLTPRMVRVTLTGAALAGFQIREPAASVRLLLPVAKQLITPVWNGNEFLLADGTRPAIRTFTPRRFDAETLDLDLDIVLHEGGAASRWAEAAKPGDPAAISGPGRGYTIGADATAFLLAGDETAIPAICQLLEVLPDAPITVHIEINRGDARLDLHRPTTITWHQSPNTSPPGVSLLGAIQDAEVLSDTRIWAAGEAASMHRIRKHLFEERGVPRAHATVRGYWKHARKD